MKNLFLVLFLFLFGLSCTKHSDKEMLFRINDLDIYPLDNSGEMPQVYWVDSLRMNVYGFRMNLFTTVQKDFRYFDEHESSVICENGIKSISITCNDSFASGFPKGSLLNRCFMHFTGSYSDLKSIEDNGPMYLSRKNYPDYKNNPLPTYADLILVKPPQWPGRYKFYVTLKLMDETTLMDSIYAIKLY